MNNKQSTLPDCKIHFVPFKTCSTRLPKAMIKQLYDTRRLKLRAIDVKFLILFYFIFKFLFSALVPTFSTNSRGDVLLRRLEIDWRETIYIYLRDGYVFESRFLGRNYLTDFHEFASLIKNGRTLRKCYSFFLGIKASKISAYVKNHLLAKNVNNFETLRQIFL